METISNQAHVTFTYAGSRGTRTNDSNIVNTSMRNRYDISVEKTSTTTCFRPGDTITYMVHVTSTSCGCVHNFEIKDNLCGEEYVDYVEGSAILFIDGSMREITPSDLSPLTFYVPESLNRDEGFILQYSVVVDEEIDADVDEITNEVRVKAYPCGCNCDCNGDSDSITETASLTIPKCLFAEVLIAKATSCERVCRDEELDYYITLTNTGNIDAANVVVTDYMPQSFTATEIHMENNGNHYKFNESEYTIDANNLLTVPNATGTPILVPSLKPGSDNTTRLRIHGHM